LFQTPATDTFEGGKFPAIEEHMSFPVVAFVFLYLGAIASNSLDFTLASTFTHELASRFSTPLEQLLALAPLNKRQLRNKKKRKKRNPLKKHLFSKDFDTLLSAENHKHIHGVKFEECLKKFIVV
jgi:hypothetical protein